MAQVDNRDKQRIKNVSSTRRRLDAAEARTQTRRDELEEAMKEAYPAFTMQEIADAAGVSRARAHQVIRR